MWWRTELPVLTPQGICTGQDLMAKCMSRARCAKRALEKDNPSKKRECTKLLFLAPNQTTAALGTATSLPRSPGFSVLSVPALADTSFLATPVLEGLCGPLSWDADQALPSTCKTSSISTSLVVSGKIFRCFLALMPSGFCSYVLLVK